MINKILNKIKYYLYIISFYVFHPVRYFKKIFNEFSAPRIQRFEYPGQDKVSILIITYNALEYIQKCLDSLVKTHYRNYEIIVFDNASDQKVKDYLKEKEKQGSIKLFLSAENVFYVKGNNLASKLSSSDSKYLLLLNSDVEIINPLWLDALLSNIPSKGIIAFGKTDIPVVRPDGWCFMVARETFFALGGLNEFYQMNWGITEFTSRVLKNGFGVKIIVNPKEYIHHFGQKSYSAAMSSTRFNQMTQGEVISLFQGTVLNFLKV